MPLFKVDIEKRLGSEFWSNRYIVQAVDLNNARGLANDIAEQELTIHLDIVTLTRMRVSTDIQNDGVYDIIPIAQQGQRSVGVNGAALPLFNTLRLDITAATGRPSRKFYRGVLGEGNINGDAMTEPFTAFRTQMLTLLGGGIEEGITDPQNTPLVNIIVWPFVQMRQLRRSRRRRTNNGGIFQ